MAAIFYRDDFDTLVKKAAEVERVPKIIPGAADVTTEQTTGQQRGLKMFGPTARSTSEAVGGAGSTGCPRKCNGTTISAGTSKESNEITYSLDPTKGLIVHVKMSNRYLRSVNSGRTIHYNISATDDSQVADTNYVHTVATGTVTAIASTGNVTLYRATQASDPGLVWEDASDDLSTDTSKTKVPSYVISAEPVKPRWMRHWMLNPRKITRGTVMPAGLFKEVAGRWQARFLPEEPLRVKDAGHLELMVRYYKSFDEEKALNSGAAGRKVINSETTW